MKKIVIIIFIIIVCIIGFISFNGNKQTKTITEDAIEVATSNKNEIEINNNIMNQEKQIKIEENISLNDNKQIVLDIDEIIKYPENVNTYKYEIKEVDDIVRTNLFSAIFGEKSSMAEYDERNRVWEIRNSSKVADYWLYSLSYTNGGVSIPGENSFVLEYRNVNLNPLESNQKNSLSDINVGISKESAITLCDKIINNLDSENEYKVDWIHVYGTKNGSNPFYWINYKKIIDEMPLTAYNDLYFFVDKNGVQKVYGTLYDIGEGNNTNIITVEDAIKSLKDKSISISTSKIDILKDTIYVKEIALEYLVTLDINGNPSITPVWRFKIGIDDDERNLYRDRILAINAINGEIIQERREKTF